MLKSKRGFTLLELVVAIAVDAIAVTAICLTAAIYQKTNTENLVRYNGVIEVSRVELALKNWARRYDNTNYSFAVSEGTVACVKKGTAVYETVTLSDDGKNLVAKDASGKQTEVLYNADSPMSLTFSVLAPTEGRAQKMLIWHIVYNNNTEAETSFVYATHTVGNQVNG